MSNLYIFKKHVFFFIEYLSGGSLDWYLTINKVLTENQVRFYTAQVIFGILFLHSNEIVHR